MYLINKVCTSVLQDLESLMYWQIMDLAKMDNVNISLLHLTELY